ncbi:integrase core domain-containing protein [Streptomyces canus]|uniref:integrase core domain-containing protein n=1 Tax=Streptomyces canus TaxID=58343 RepID=UPI0027D8D646|nr:integrase core domain-containing protein [Streptomyces canus]
MLKLLALLDTTHVVRTNRTSRSGGHDTEGHGTDQGPWRDADQVERAVVQWVGWYNTERLHSTLDYLPPEEFEAAYYRSLFAPNAT